MNNRNKTAEVTAEKPTSGTNGTPAKADAKKPAQSAMDYQAGFTSGCSL